MSARPESHLPDIHRLLPKSEDAEQGLICSFLLDPRRIGSLCAERGITHASFHIPAHATMFSTLMAMWTEGVEIDLVTLTQALRDRGQLDQCGGSAHVTQLFTFLPTAALAGEYAEIIAEKATLREIIRVCTEAAGLAYDAHAEATTLLHRAAESLGEIATKRHAHAAKPKTFAEALADKIARMENATPDADVIRTGIEKLDHHSPLRLGGMMLISGEKKSGKSILSLTIATNIIRDGRPVLYFSLEDPMSAVVDRVFAGASKIPMIRHHVSTLTECDFPRVVSTVTELSSKPLVIRDDIYDLPSIVAVSRQTKTQRPDLAAIVIDYAQLVRVERRHGDNREQEVATISRTLRLLGMELNCAILLLCQLNKDGDTRESKALEQDCTAMVKVMRCDPDESGKRLLTIPFQRNGESGIAFPVAFLGHIARFENLSAEEEE